MGQRGAIRQMADAEKSMFANVVDMHKAKDIPRPSKKRKVTKKRPLAAQTSSPEKKPVSIAVPPSPLLRSTKRKMKAARMKKEKVVEQSDATEADAPPAPAVSSRATSRGSNRKKMRRSQNQIHDGCSSLLPSDTCAKHA